MEDPNTTTSDCPTSSASLLHTTTTTTPFLDNHRQYDLNHELTKLVSKKGSVTEVKKLLKQCADPNGVKDVFGKGALYYAIEHKNSALVRLLLEHKADPDATFIYDIYDTKGNRSMLWLAARSNKIETIHTLLQYVKKKNPKCDPPYENSLMKAIEKQNLALVQLLYEAGVSMPFKKKSLGRTNPLKLLKDSQLRIYLMQNGMYIPRKYLVIICSKRNNPNCYNELRAACERGANVNPCHKQCESKRPAKCECKCPLAITTCAGQVDLSLLLLNFGADPNGNWKSCNRGYPLIYTRAFDAFRNTPTEHSTKTLGLLRTLLTLGADPTIAVSFDEHNKLRTALDNIIRIDYYKLLIDHGAVLCPRDRIVSNELLQYIIANDLSATPARCILRWLHDGHVQRVCVYLMRYIENRAELSCSPDDRPDAMFFNPLYYLHRSNRLHLSAAIGVGKIIVPERMVDMGPQFVLSWLMCTFPEETWHTTNKHQSWTIRQFASRAQTLIVCHHIAYAQNHSGILSAVPRELLRELLVSLMAVVMLM